MQLNNRWSRRRGTHIWVTHWVAGYWSPHTRKFTLLGCLPPVLLHLQDMEVLHRNITEALRMHPPLVLLLRYCKEPFTVTTSQGKQYTIPKVRAAGLGRGGMSGTPTADLIKVMSQSGRFYRGWARIACPSHLLHQPLRILTASVTVRCLPSP